MGARRVLLSLVFAGLAWVAMPARAEAAAPTITSLSPPSGSTAGGTIVTVTGTGFTPSATVTVDGAPATVVGVAPDGTILGIEMPAHAAATVDVIVTTSLNVHGQQLT